MVCSAAFLTLLAASVALILLFCLLEPAPLGRGLLAAFDQLGAPLRPRAEDLIRACTAAFFVALGTLGGIVMTPELITQAAWVPWLQWGIAAALFTRPTMPLGAAGIVLLYAIGLHDYGLFHMLDYPIFLGIAAYLTLTALPVRARPRAWRRTRPIDVARYATGITLMWASIEKWAYPEWTFPLLHAKPGLLLGLTPRFYMTACGFVEFALAFGLLWTPLVRRLSAFVLAIMFVSAVLEFGKIDAIGHLPIIMLLLVIAADNAPAPARRPLHAPLWCGGALAFYLLAYYGIHAMLFGTPIL